MEKLVILNPVKQITSFNLNLTNKEAAALYWEMQEAIKYVSPETYPQLHILYEQLSAFKVAKLEKVVEYGYTSV